MKPDEKTKPLLAFDPPDAPASANFSVDEKNCVGFAAKILERYRALRTEFEAKGQETQRYWQEKEDLQKKLEGFLVRNLIPIMDECKLALEAGDFTASTTQESPAAVDPLATMRASAPPAPKPGGPPQLDVAGFFRRIERQLLSLLNGLDIQRVELMGKTYETVVVDGETIPEPFGIDDTGKGGGAIVTKVIDDLWVRRRFGALQVVRKGKVIC